MDVIIIGSGPASFAALNEITKAGYTTIIICRKWNVIDGDDPAQSVHPGIEGLLEYLGLPGLLGKVKRSTHTGIWTNEVYRPLDPSLSETWMGYHINRTQFDLALREELVRKQIQLIDDAGIDDIQIDENGVLLQLSDGRKLISRYLIDGSGSARVVAKKLRLKQHVYSPSLIVYSALISNIDPAQFAQLKTSFTSDEYGWTWLAPEAPDKCTWTKMNVNNERRVPVKVPAEFENCKIGPVLQSNVKWNIVRTLFYKRVLLCGDAGAILDPGTGQGILTALLSGIRAGEAVTKCLANESERNSYMEQYDEWFFNHFTTNAAALSAYYSEMRIAGFSNVSQVSEL